MISIRKGVFETNSSSTHSVSVRSNKSYSDPDVEEARYDLNYDEKDGYLHSSIGDFGWEIESYTEPDSKLSYLLTMICATSGISTSSWRDADEEAAASRIRSELEKNEEYKRLNRKLMELTKSNGIYLDECIGGIDHQSVEDYSSMREFLSDWHVDDAIRFIFDYHITLYTDNDNH